MCQYLRMDADTRRCGRFPDSEYVELAVEVFALLADATRVRIVLALRDAGELPVNALAETLDRPASTVSQHLAKMRMARMVSTRQHGQRVFYRLTDEHAVRLVTDAIFQAEHAVSSSPRHHHTAASSASDDQALTEAVS
jgi:DNA-binding transcriptional ArsR family regulator